MGYRLYFLDHERDIRARHELDTPDDQSALAKAEALFATHQRFPFAELWDGDRLVLSFQR
jgi:hypothetical protein